MNAALAQDLFRRHRARRLADFADASTDAGLVAGATAAAVEPQAAAEGWSFQKAVVVGVTVGLITTYAVRVLDSIFGGRK